MYARKHGMRSAGSMPAMTSRALAHHRLAMDGMQGSFVVMRAIREDGRPRRLRDPRSELDHAVDVQRDHRRGRRCTDVGARTFSPTTPGSTPSTGRRSKPASTSTSRAGSTSRTVAPDGATSTSSRSIATSWPSSPTDITRDVEAHLELERSASRFASLIIGSSDLACIVDATGDNPLRAAVGVSQFLGFTDDELGAPLERVTQDRSRRGGRLVRRSLLASGRSSGPIDRAAIHRPRRRGPHLRRHRREPIGRRRDPRHRAERARRLAVSPRPRPDWPRSPTRSPT